MRKFVFLLAFSVGLFTGGAAGAVTLLPYEMTVSLGGDTLSLADLESGGLVGFRPSTYGGSYYTYGPIVQEVEEGESPDWQVNSWSSAYDTDPFVTNNLNVTNLSGVTQIFSVTVLSPVVPQGPFTEMDGSVGITITSSPTPAAGVTLTSALGADVYTALIDGGPVQSLANDPYTLTCGGNTCSITQSFDFGDPIPVAGPPAAFTIGITIQFALSPGDSAGVTSVFNIVAVPEPATLLLFGGGLAGIAFFGRRRA